MTFLLSYRIANPNYPADFCDYRPAGCDFNQNETMDTFFCKSWAAWEDPKQPAQLPQPPDRNALERIGNAVYRCFNVLDNGGGRIFRIWTQNLDDIVSESVRDRSAPGAARFRLPVVWRDDSRRASHYDLGACEPAICSALDAALRRHERGKFRAAGLIFEPDLPA